MGIEWEDKRGPKRPKPKKAKSSGGSGQGSGHQVGLAIAIFGGWGSIMLVAVGYVVWGHLQ